MAIRIQRKRTRGWKAPEGAVYVGRPTEWGNPWTVGLVACGCRSAGECDHNCFRVETAEEAVDMYRRWASGWSDEKKQRCRDQLSGKDQMDWCSLDKPCHADVTLEIANA